MKKVWDNLGIAFSSACVVHCLLVAFLPLIFPMLSVYSHITWVHAVVGIVILFTTPLAFVPGYRRHGHMWIVATAMAGLFVIALGMILEDKVSEQMSHGVSILGSLILVFAHVKNIQHQRHSHQECC